MIPLVSLDLSNYRIDYLFSFKATGLDYAGTLYIRPFEKDVVFKVYILLLTCASSQAKHLKLTPDMQVPSLIRGFKHFMLRRGIPDVAVSVNFNFSVNEGSCYNIRLLRNSFYLPHLVGGILQTACQVCKKRP